MDLGDLTWVVNTILHMILEAASKLPVEGMSGCCFCLRAILGFELRLHLQTPPVCCKPSNNV